MRTAVDDENQPSMIPSPVVLTVVPPRRATPHREMSSGTTCVARVAEEQRFSGSSIETPNDQTISSKRSSCRHGTNTVVTTSDEPPATSGCNTISVPTFVTNELPQAKHYLEPTRRAS
jgi:hypothetical protein